MSGTRAALAVGTLATFAGGYWAGARGAPPSPVVADRTSSILPTRERAVVRNPDVPRSVGDVGAGVEQKRGPNAGPGGDVPPSESAPTASGTEGSAAASALDWNDARVERDGYVAQLEASGPDSIHLSIRARAVDNAWSSFSQASGMDVTFTPWRCFRAGCFTTAVHGSSDIVDEFSAGLTHVTEFRQWDGNKIMSGKVRRPDGRVEITWMLLAPESHAESRP